MTQRRLSVRLRVQGRRTRRLAWRLVRQQYVTLVSVAVIGALFATVMTSDSFVSREKRPAAPTDGPRDAAAARTSPPRHTVLFYVVNDQKQLTDISEAFVDDLPARAGGPFQVDQVYFLIAGTDQEEAAAISRLNAEALLVQGTTIDLKVVDVRGRFGR
jgi:hypothetical protein